MVINFKFPEVPSNQGSGLFQTGLQDLFNPPGRLLDFLW